MNLPIPRNVGAADRVARVIGGAGVAAVPLAMGASLPVALPVGLFGAGILVSGALGRCSIYRALGVSTRAPDQG